jgi:hypothetical protein
VLVCKTKAIESLMEDIHANLQDLTVNTYFNSRCSINQVYSQVCTYALCKTNIYGEMKDIYISSTNLNTHETLNIKSKILFLNIPPYTLQILSTEKI